MRFLELRLVAFGGFEGLTLDFSTPGLHVVFGRNEVGKSTTLRAMSHVLYGIPERTSDAYKFPMASLRIGARLQADDGTVLDVVRKKGRTKTLLDREDHSVDDAPLLKMLHGVSAELYETSFGLTHGALQRGARALLDGGGDLGESLFQAGLGGAELHRLLVELRAEADQIWSPTARTKPLNEVMRVIAEAKKNALDKNVSHEAYEKQVAHIEAQRARKEGAAVERSQLLLEQKRLQRLKGMLSSFAKQGALAARRAALGEVVVLPEGAPRDRADALQAQAEAAANIGRLEREIADITTRRALLTAPDGLADAAAELDGLQGQLALFVKSEQELPRLRATLDAEDAEARRIARAIAGDAVSPAALRADTKATARVRTLFSEPKRIQALLRAAERARDDAAADLAARSGTASADTERVQGVAQRVERRWKALGLVHGDLARAVALALPAPITVDRHEREMVALAEEARREEEQRAALERESVGVDRDIDALQRAAAVPTEADLEAVRARRDGLWARLRIEFEAGVAREFEQAAALADEVADRLRREAERVTRLAKLLADQTTVRAALVRSDEARASFAEREQELSLAWKAEWAPVGIAPLSPPEMRAWLERHAKLVEAFDELEATKADAQRAEAAERARLARDVEHHERERAALGKELVAWQSEWRAALEKLGVPGDLGVEEGLAVTGELGVLGQRVEAADVQRVRVEAAIAENARIAARVRALTLRLAPDLASSPTTEAGQQLVRRFELARQERAQRQTLDGQLEEKRASLSAQLARRDASGSRLAALMAAAGVTDLDALVAAEERSSVARALASEESLANEVLLAKADGAPLSELAAAAKATRAEVVDTRLDEIEARLAALDDELHQATIEMDRSERGLLALDRGDAASAAAGEVQAAVARAQGLVERWARVKLAEAVLSREIQRYREQNQGPVLGRASEVFQRLTRGAYKGLRAGLDEDSERPLLLAAKDGGDVPTHQLSDGARDQVYLALRVASLERHAAAAGPLPLVVDDILIQFDDDRARAALEVLAELSKTVQVIFFSHHQHLVDLARASVPARLTVHELGRAPAAPVQLALTP